MPENLWTHQNQIPFALGRRFILQCCTSDKPRFLYPVREMLHRTHLVWIKAHNPSVKALQISLFPSLEYSSKDKKSASIILGKQNRGKGN